MIHSTRPQGFNWSRFAQERPAEVEINWEHPITDRLYGCWLLGRGAPRNLAASRPSNASGVIKGSWGHGTFSASGAPANGLEYHGPAGVWANLNEGIDIGTSSLWGIERTEPFTIVVFQTPNVLRSGASLSYTLWANTEDTASPARGIRYQLNWNAIVPGQTVQLLSLVNTIGTNLLQAYDNTDLGNTGAIIAVRYSGSSTVAGVDFYHPAHFAAGTSQADLLSATIVPTSPLPAIGRRTISGAVGQAYKGTISMLWFWRRQLKRQEIWTMDLDWQSLLIVPSYRRWSIPAAPIVGTPITRQRAGVYA